MQNEIIACEAHITAANQQAPASFDPKRELLLAEKEHGFSTVTAAKRWGCCWVAEKLLEHAAHHCLSKEQGSALVAEAFSVIEEVALEDDLDELLDNLYYWEDDYLD